MAASQVALEFDADEEASRGCTENLLLSSLPKTSNCVGTLYKYEGFWCYKVPLVGILACQKHFQVQDSDILLSSFPKCGTTWLMALVYALVNREKHLVGSKDHPLMTKNPHDLVPFLEVIGHYFDKAVLPDSITTNLPPSTFCPTDLPVSAGMNVMDIPHPRLFATHSSSLSLAKEFCCSKRKVIYICRNPKDTFVSMWYFSNKLRPEGVAPDSIEKAFDMFCNGMCMRGPFWDHVLEFWKASLEMPEKVMFLKYEELNKQPKLHLLKIAEFLGYPFSKEEEGQGVPDEIVDLCSFGNLSNLNVNKTGRTKIGIETSYFFRRGEVGDSGHLLTREMIDKLDRITQEKFSPYGLKI